MRRMPPRARVRPECKLCTNHHTTLPHPQLRLLLPALLLLCLSGAGFALTNIGACPATLSTSSETYNITSDLSSAATCLTVQAGVENITVQGNGFTLTGASAAPGNYGVYAFSVHNVTVKDLTVRNYSYGVSFSNGNSIYIRNCSVPYTRGNYNFEMSFGTFFFIENNSAANPSGSGVLLYSDTITHSQVAGNSFGDTSAAQMAYLRQPENVSVYGNTFTGASAANGITARSFDSGSRMYNNDFQVGQRAVYIQGGYDSAIWGNRISNGAAGIRMEDHAILYPLDNVSFTGNNLTGLAGIGIHVYSAGASNTNCIISGNRVQTAGTAINITNVRSNGIYDNTFTGSIPAYDTGANKWNITEQAGPNILGGQDIGGNYYSGYSGFDTDWDGIGDTADYAIPGGANADYLPLTDKKGVGSCTVVNVPGEFQLTQNISGAPIPTGSVPSVNGACLVIASSNVDLSCAGLNITHDGTLMTAGILVNGSASLAYTNVTIRDCPHIYNYGLGIYLYRSPQNFIRNVTAHRIVDGGFVLSHSDRCTISNSSAYGNQGGIYVEYSERAGIHNSTIHHISGEAMHIERSGYVEVTGNTVYSVPGPAIILPDSSGHATIRNNTVYSSGYGIIIGENCDDANVTLNTAYGNTYGFYLYRADRTRLISNTAYDNDQCFAVTLNSRDTVLMHNLAYGSGMGFAMSTGTNYLENNTARNNRNDGFRLVGTGAYSTFVENTAHDNTQYGFFISGSDYNVLRDNLAYGNNRSGFQANSSSDYNNFTDNVAHSGRTSGFGLYECAYNRFSNNIAYNISGPGFSTLGWVSSVNNNTAYDCNDAGFLTTGTGTVLWDNRAHDNVHGFAAAYTDGVTFRNNTAYGNIALGMAFVGVTGSSIEGGTAYSNMIGVYVNESRGANITVNGIYSNDYGIFLGTSNDSRIGGNEIYSNNLHGIFIDPSHNNTVVGNNIYGNSLDGLYLEDSHNNTIDNNTAHDNSRHGFHLNISADNMFTDNTAYGNSHAGVYVYNSGGNDFSDTVLYGNGPDLLLNNTGGSAMAISMADTSFRDAGNTAHSVISMADSVSSPSSYSIGFLSLPGTLPENRTGFVEKFVGITAHAGAVSISSVAWTWTDAEASGYNESAFELWEYASGSWSLLNNTPDIVSNILALSGLVPASGYGPLNNGPSPSAPGSMSPVSNATFVEEGRYNYAGGMANDTTEGGNITGFNLTGNDSTDRWAGYFGNVSGEIVLGINASNIMYGWVWNGAAGEVCATAAAGTFDWAGIAAATAQEINSIFSHVASSDNATNTLADGSGAIDIEGTSITSTAATDIQGWQTVAIGDGGGASKADYAFCVNLTSGAPTVAGSNGNYQLMVATQPATIENYYFFLDLS